MRPSPISGLPAIIVTLFIVFFITPLGLNHSYAQKTGTDPVGNVVAIRGNVFAFDSQSKKRVLTIKAPVYLNDTIKTTQGRIQIIFKDKTIVTLGRKTQMKITRYIWQPDNPESAMETHISEGSFRIMGGSITKTAPQNFKTNTPSGTIGIRGSMYAGLVKESFLEVFFQGGKGIVIHNNFGSVEIKRPGFTTTIKGSASGPQKPKKADPKRLQAFENTIAVGSDEPSDKQHQDSNEQSLPDKPSRTPSKKAPAGHPPDQPKSLSRLPEIASSIITSNQIRLDNDIDSLSTIEKKIVLSLLDLGFVGSRSTSVPFSGIWIYKGITTNILENDPDDGIQFMVNWDNHRIIGFDKGYDFDDGDTQIDTDTDPGFGFGFGSVTLNGGIEDMTIIGSDGNPDTMTISAITGSETFGHFYGTNQEGLGIAIEGYDINLRDPLDQTFWQDIAAATLVAKIDNSNTGTHTWNGFFIGVAEDMDDIQTNRRIFANTTSDDFQFTIEKDNGTLHGLMSGNDFINDANAIKNLTIGANTTDKTQSIYIDDKTLAAKLDGRNAIIIDSKVGGVKPYGNFMVTSDEPALSNHTTWGYWETAYSDPSTGKDYHIHVPGALWVAGKQTPSTEIAKRLSGDFKGTYTGKAKGILIDGHEITQLMNGTTNLSIDFKATSQIAGSISFTGHTLFVTSSNNAVTPSGFTASIAGASKSNVAGTFFGPLLEAIGGNFSADISNRQYHGIFAGDK